MDGPGFCWWMTKKKGIEGRAWVAEFGTCVCHAQNIDPRSKTFHQTFLKTYSRNKFLLDAQISYDSDCYLHNDSNDPIDLDINECFLFADADPYVEMS